MAILDITKHSGTSPSNPGHYLISRDILWNITPHPGTILNAVISWEVGIESLHTLRVVVVTSVTHSHVRSPHCQFPTVIVAGRSVAELGSFIHHLQKKWREGEWYGGIPSHTHTHTHTRCSRTMYIVYTLFTSPFSLLQSLR